MVQINGIRGQQLVLMNVLSFTKWIFDILILQTGHRTFLRSNTGKIKRISVRTIHTLVYFKAISLGHVIKDVLVEAFKEILIRNKIKMFLLVLSLLVFFFCKPKFISIKFVKINYYNKYLCGFLHSCLCTMCVSARLWDQKKTIDCNWGNW